MYETPANTTVDPHADPIEDPIEDQAVDPAKLEDDRTRLRERIQRYENEVRTLQNALQSEGEARRVILNSLSWRMTAPLRAVSLRWWGLRRKLAQLPAPRRQH